MIALLFSKLGVKGITDVSVQVKENAPLIIHQLTALLNLPLLLLTSAIMGVAVVDSQDRYPDAVKFLCPKHVFPVHQDNFFSPLENGFQFAAMANFPKIL